MFKLQPNPTFWANVKIPVPDETGAGSLDIQFKHKTKSALSDYLDRARNNKLAELDAMLEICAGWKGLDAEFSRENMATLLENYPAAARAINDGYVLALTQGRTKN